MDPHLFKIILPYQLQMRAQVKEKSIHSGRFAEIFQKERERIILLYGIVSFFGSLDHQALGL